MVLSLGKPGFSEYERFEVFSNVVLGKDVQRLSTLILIAAAIVSGIVGLGLLAINSVIVALFAVPMVFIATNALFWVFIKGIFRKRSRREDSLAYLALNEFVAVLRATKSLRDAVELVANGNFGRISEFFAQSLHNSNLGTPLITALAASFEKNFYGASRQYFLRSFALWDLSPDLIDHFAQNLAFSIQTQYREDTERIRELSSAYIGLGGLAPPIICAVLLISGRFDWLAVFCLVLFLLSLKAMMSPGNLLDDGDLLSPNTQVRSSEILMTLAGYLALGDSFEKSLFQTLQVIQNQGSNPQLRKSLVRAAADMSFGQSWPEESILKTLKAISGNTIVRLYQIIKSISRYDYRLAPKRVIQLAEAIQKNENLVEERLQILRTERFRSFGIQAICCLSLGVLVAVSPIFQFVGDLSTISLEEYQNLASRGEQYLVTTLFQILAVCIAASTLPLEYLEKNGASDKWKSPFGEPLRVGFVLLFLGLFLLSFLVANSLTSPLQRLPGG
ncbi:MAG: hypothetical protein ACFFGZ_01155 [Candidatus Thorarchaeota archaeon]